MADSLRLHRLRMRYRVPPGAQSVAVQGTMDSAIRERLSECLSSAVPAEKEGGVWLIRRLRLRSAVALDWSKREIARQVANQLVRELRKTLDAGPQNDEVMWFPSRSAYLAHFLVDCAAGRAFGLWQYAEFEKLSGLAVATALREVLAADPEVSRGAFKEMLPLEPELVVRHLTPQVADELLGALATGAPNGGHGVVVEALVGLLASGRMPTDRRTSALALFVAALRRGCHVPENLAREVAAAASLFLGIAVSARERLTRCIAAGDLATIVRLCDGDAAGRLAGLATWPEADRRRLAGALADPGDLRSQSVESDSTETRFGGGFLLLPMIREFDWVTDGWPDLDGLPAVDVLRFLTIVATFGMPRNGGVFADRALRKACGIPPAIGGAEIARWTRRVSRRGASAFHSAWLDGVMRRGAAGNDRQLVPIGREAVEIDAARGMWTEVRGIASATGAQEANTGSRLSIDVEYATLDDAFALPTHVRRLIAMTAQNILREFAWHLPGFSRSSLPYLFANFLDFGARIQSEEDRIVVAMDKPPLHLVLNATSLSRQTFRLPATGDRPWVLTQRS